MDYTKAGQEIAHVVGMNNNPMMLKIIRNQCETAEQMLEQGVAHYGHYFLVAMLTICLRELGNVRRASDAPGKEVVTLMASLAMQTFAETPQ